MSNEFAPVWQECEKLLQMGVNLIPVRSKEETIKGKFFGKKTPYEDWIKYQTEFIDRAILFDLMNKYDTTSVAMVCGKISGNLVVIDIDVKYKQGADLLLFNAIKEFYPELLKILRVHISPSNGAHILYRIEQGHEVPRSGKLASRKATDEELAINEKSKSKTFIEIKAEGGLCTTPPSAGYRIRRDVPIPTLKIEQHTALIELCRSFNEYVKEEKPFKPSTTDINYYDENPFEHYNRTVDPTELFIECGWAYVKKSGDFLWFTRPGGKKDDVHGSYRLDKGFYYIFSSNTDLESERAYTPATILALYKFNGDKSACYAHLVSLGFGKIKPHIEAKLAKTRAIQDEPLPANISDKGKEIYSEIKEQLQKAHPFGIFWEPDEKGDIKISRLAFTETATGLGFRIYDGEIVQIVGIYIHKRDERFLFDTMRCYIKEEDPNLYEEIYNETQSFFQRNGKFEISQLPFLETEKILTDSRHRCYKFYLNGYVEITKEGYNLFDYSFLTDTLIWHEKLHQRNFVFYSGNGLFSDFLKLACEYSTTNEHVKKCIGWLAHDFKDATTAYIIVLTEKCADPRDGGGSGKNLFCQLLEHTTTYTSVPASQKGMDNTKLLNSWNGEKIFALSDARKDFDFELLKEPAGGNAILKKLFKDEKSIKSKDVPKFIVQTNFSFEITDGGLRRRIIAIEFTNFFTNCGGVNVHFGKTFPDDWSENDWKNYDNTICDCICSWLQSDLKLKSYELSATGWEKQFFMTYGQIVFDFFSQNWESWIKLSFISNTEFNNQLESYLIENNMSILKFKPSSIKINKALDDWCKKYNYTMDKNENRYNGVQYERGRKFYENPPF